MKLILSEDEILTAVRTQFEVDPQQVVTLCVVRKREADRPTFSAEVTDPEAPAVDRALKRERRRRKVAEEPEVSATRDAAADVPPALNGEPLGEPGA